MNDRERFEDTFSLIHSTASKELLFETRKDGRYASLVTNSAYEMWKAATAESAARIAEIEQKLVEISSLMTLWKKGLLTGDELGKSLFVVHESKPAITNTGSETT